MKKFITITNGGCVTYKDIFPYVLKGDITLGASKGMCGLQWFEIPIEMLDKTAPYWKIDNGICYTGVAMCTWLTNVKHNNMPKPYPLTKEYNSSDYPKYDNYDAINVDRVRKIPKDYYGVMGVPISFLDKLNTDQFEFIGKISPILNGKHLYTRLLIKRKCGAAFHPTAP